MKIIVTLSLTLCLLFGSTASAQLAQVTGALINLRSKHESQLLQNGQVLAFGGTNSGTSSAELYDPAAGTWRATGEMQEARTQFTSVLLDNGQVLAIGGANTTGELSSCEVYDPSAGTWTLTAPLSSPASFAASTKLPDGRVLMMYQTTCEIYHPDSAQWYPAASPSTQRRELILMNDGNVLALGLSSNLEVYDPNADTWTAVSGTIRGSVNLVDGVHILPDDRILIIGATAGNADIFDPASGTVQAAGDMLVGLPFASSVTANNGNILTFGASSATNGADTKTIQVYNPADDQWFSEIYTFYGPGSATMHVLPDGNILSVGGNARLGGLEPNCYLINPSVTAVSNDPLVESLGVTLYPNPVRGALYLDIEERVEGDIRLLDLQGRHILQQPIQGMQAQLSLAHLPRGIFLVQILSNKGILFQEKIVLK